MRFDIITIFPKIFDAYFSESIIGRAQRQKIITIKTHDLRRWASDRHKTVDDRPFGGGPGMVMMVEPIFKAVKVLKNFSILNFQFSKLKQRVILFSAKGKRMTQKDVRRWAKNYNQLILICGRYEGVDERVAQHIADEEISVGEYVLTGGEIPAMIVVDAVARLLPGVLGKKESLLEESFSKKEFLEYPQYTRPEEFKNWPVPSILLSGDHKKIKEWQQKNSLKSNEDS